jgi:hypothetical protein
MPTDHNNVKDRIAGSQDGWLSAGGKFERTLANVPNIVGKTVANNIGVAT